MLFNYEQLKKFFTWYKNVINSFKENSKIFNFTHVSDYVTYYKQLLIQKREEQFLQLHKHKDLWLNYNYNKFSFENYKDYWNILKIKLNLYHDYFLTHLWVNVIFNIYIYIEEFFIFTKNYILVSQVWPDLKEWFFKNFDLITSIIPTILSNIFSTIISVSLYIVNFLKSYLNKHENLNDTILIINFKELRKRLEVWTRIFEFFQQKCDLKHAIYYFQRFVIEGHGLFIANSEIIDASANLWYRRTIWLLWLFFFYYIIKKSLKLIVFISGRFVIWTIRFIKGTRKFLFYLFRPKLAYQHLRFIFLRWLFLHLKKLSWIRFVYKKYDVTFNRLVNYPTTIWKQYLMYSIYDYIIGAPNSWFQYQYWNSIISKTEFRRWQLLQVHTNTKLGSFQLDEMVLLESSILSLLLIYHIYFWVSLVIKRLYIYVQFHIEAFQPLFLWCTYKVAYDAIFWLESASGVIGYNLWSFAIYSFFLGIASFAIEDEAEEGPEFGNFMIEWPFGLWCPGRSEYELERYLDGNPSDLIWEFREDTEFEERGEVDLFTTNKIYLTQLKEIRAELEVAGEKNTYAFKPTWLFKRIFELEEKEKSVGYYEDAFDKETKEARDKAYGSLKINQFALFGLIPKILKKPFITLPWENEAFSDAFRELTLAPIYLFLKNPYWTLRYWEAPFMSGNTLLPSVKKKNISRYWLLADQSKEYFFLRWLTHTVARHWYLQLSYHMGDYFLGPLHYEYQKTSIHWENLLFMRKSGVNMRYLREIIRIAMLQTRKAERTRRDLRYYRWKSFLGRYTLIEHIFFRKRIKRLELKGKIEVEELIRNGAGKTFRIDNTRTLKTRNNRYF